MGERSYLLPEKGTFYKANLHCHSTISDGELTTKEVKDIYVKQGYQVLAITDHNTYGHHKELDDDNFLVLAAIEVDMEDEDSIDWNVRKTYHFNLYDTNPELEKEKKKKLCKPFIKHNDMDEINRYLESMNELGFLACYNHPYWSLQDYDDYKNIKHCFAMEIYNYGCEIDGLYGYHPQAYDEMLRTGSRLFCVSTDDNHNRYPLEHPYCDSFGGITMIKAEELTYSSIIEALKKGEFYSTMYQKGMETPTIEELYVEDNVLHVKTSPVSKIYVNNAGRDGYKKVAEYGTSLTEASFPLNGKEGYIRVICQSREGLTANSNAYFL